MAKSDRNMEFYRQGMLRAYQLVKQDGVEALEKELRFRNITRINGPMLAKEIDTGIDQIKKADIRNNPGYGSRRPLFRIRVWQGKDRTIQRSF